MNPRRARRESLKDRSRRARFSPGRRFETTPRTSSRKVSDSSATTPTMLKGLRMTAPMGPRKKAVTRSSGALSPRADSASSPRSVRF